MTIRALEFEDWQAVIQIYAEGVATGRAVFNNELPTWEEWDASHLKACRLVAEECGKIVGWTALTAVSNRCMDSGVAEGSVYVAADSRGKGVGKVLLNALIEASEKAGLWMLQAQIIQENTASIRLCEACGFRMVGYRERINRDTCGAWHNLVLMERRSKVVEGNCSCGCGC